VWCRFHDFILDSNANDSQWLLLTQVRKWQPFTRDQGGGSRAICLSVFGWCKVKPEDQA
jgi:hypothetical protein